jgi:nitroreductase
VTVAAGSEPVAPASAVDAAIRGRRTHKRYRAEPVARAVLDGLLELARFAPNHRLTHPWRFRVVGPETLARLKRAAAAGGPDAAAKLDRAPALVIVSTLVHGDPVQAEEDTCATAIAAYIVLLAAHARGLAGYWRTPAVLRSRAGRAAAGIPDDERVLGLLHLGYPVEEPATPRREEPDAYATYTA